MSVRLVFQNFPTRSRKSDRHTPPRLDSLYKQMMQEIRKSEEHESCREILNLITAIYHPIMLQELASIREILAEYPNNAKSLKEAIRLCGSLTIHKGTAFFVSAKDYLTGIVSQELFLSGIESVHHTIFLRSLSSMELTLHHDLYSLRNPGFPINKVRRPEPRSTKCCVVLMHLLSQSFTWSSSYHSGGTTLKLAQTLQLLMWEVHLLAQGS